jgi:hypothetical protein
VSAEKKGRKAGEDAIQGFFLLPFSFFLSMRTSHRGHDFATRREKQKTYRRFSGMIFLAGVCSRLVLETQRFATRKIPKNRKNKKKV